MCLVVVVVILQFVWCALPDLLDNVNVISHGLRLRDAMDNLQVVGSIGHSLRHYPRKESGFKEAIKIGEQLGAILSKVPSLFLADATSVPNRKPEVASSAPSFLSSEQLTQLNGTIIENLRKKLPNAPYGDQKEMKTKVNESVRRGSP
jgi:hypothetical protein